MQYITPKRNYGKKNKKNLITHNSNIVQYTSSTLLYIAKSLRNFISEPYAPSMHNLFSCELHCIYLYMYSRPAEACSLASDPIMNIYLGDHATPTLTHCVLRKVQFSTFLKINHPSVRIVGILLDGVDFDCAYVNFSFL